MPVFPSHAFLVVRLTLIYLHFPTAQGLGQAQKGFPDYGVVYLIYCVVYESTCILIKKTLRWLACSTE